MSVDVTRIMHRSKMLRKTDLGLESCQVRRGIYPNFRLDPLADKRRLTCWLGHLLFSTVSPSIPLVLHAVGVCTVPLKRINASNMHPVSQPTNQGIFTHEQPFT
jgi:hypothetical protein